MEKNYILGSQMKMTYFPNIKNIFKSLINKEMSTNYDNMKGSRDLSQDSVLDLCQTVINELGWETMIV